MPEPVTIPASPPKNHGLDFAWLKAEGTRLIQEASGEVWTDYNESDPGVTTLEQLCYALTELSYRAELPVEDLLTGEPDGGIDPRRQALYPARDILPGNPLTERDYRKLLIDRVPSVGNAWLAPWRPAAGTPRAVQGLWDLALYVPALDPCCNPCGEREVLQRARQVYGAHRGLCEDLRSVAVLQPVPVTVYGEVEMDRGAQPEAVLASVLFRLALLFAPEPARRPLGERVRAGVQPSTIFEGPLMLHGFIDDCELQPRASSFAVTDVARTVAGTPGVAAACRITVATGGHTWRDTDKVPVGRGSVLALQTRPGRGGYGLKLLCRGVEVKPDPARVERELRRLWTAHRRRHPLQAEYDAHFGMPAGTFRDVRRYAPVQNQYPAVYGINHYGLPAGTSAPRRAQARQLKGYLFPFEQLLADAFAQLAHARDLFSTLGPDDPQGGRSYWYQFLDGDIPGVEPLFIPNQPEGPYDAGVARYRQGLREIVESADPWERRRAGFLAFLLSLYADGVEPGAAAAADGDPCGGRGPDQDAPALFPARLELLRRVVETTGRRARGFDYLRRPSPANLSGMEMRSRIQLGMPVAERRTLSEVLEESGLELRDDAPGEEGALHWHADAVEDEFGAVGSGGGPAAPHAPAGPRRAVPEALLDHPPAPGDLRVGTLPGDAAVTAAYRAGDGWRPLGRFPDRDAATRAARGFGGALQRLRLHARQLYVVEHLLLRAGRARGEPGGFQYSLTLTAVFFLPPRLLDDEGYRAFAREVVRENTPAHLAVECCFLGYAAGRRFESLYAAWRQALARGEPRPLRQACARLRDFLRDGGAAPAPRAGG
jgi:hypothetical protein